MDHSAVLRAARIQRHKVPLDPFDALPSLLGEFQRCGCRGGCESTEESGQKQLKDMKTIIKTGKRP